jgi:hypothetical protein
MEPKEPVMVLTSMFPLKGSTPKEPSPPELSCAPKTESAALVSLLS